MHWAALSEQCGPGVRRNTQPPRFECAYGFANISWNYESRYWSESRITKGWRLREYPHHDILGSRLNDSSNFEPAWRNVLRLENASWLEDHEVSGDIIFPGAGYIGLAGEAIRQLTGSDDYTIRRLDFSQALILRRGTTTELLTNFRSTRLTKSLESNHWYDFSVSSLTGGQWIKHCAGQARAGPESPRVAIDIEDLPRAVPSSSWYNAMRRFGLGYGPRFQRLRSITAGVDDSIAVAELQDNILPIESFYTMHPSTIDLVFQLCSVASCQGFTRFLDRLTVPSYIGELYVRKPRSSMKVSAAMQTSQHVSLPGHAVGISEGEVVFQMTDYRVTTLVETGV